MHRLQRKIGLFGFNASQSWLTFRCSHCTAADARQALTLQERRLPHDAQRCTTNNLACRQANESFLRRTLDKTLQPSPTLRGQTTKVTENHWRETERVQTLAVLTLCGITKVLLTLVMLWLAPVSELTPLSTRMKHTKIKKPNTSLRFQNTNVKSCAFGDCSAFDNLHPIPLRNPNFLIATKAQSREITGNTLSDQIMPSVHSSPDITCACVV